MNNIQLAIAIACIYFAGVGAMCWAISRARPLQTVDGRTEDCSAGTAAPLVASPMGVSRDIDVDSPPVTLKLPPVYSDGDLLVTCKRVLLITGCTDPMLWYSRMVGEEVPYLGKWEADKCFKSREPAGYVNIVHFKDARVIIKESTK